MKKNKKLNLKKLEVAKLNAVKGGELDLNNINKPTNPFICDYAKSFVPRDCDIIDLGF